MAKAMRGLGFAKPKAMRATSRIRVLTDSMSPLDRPWAMEARICARCPTMRRWSVTNDSMRQRRAQATHLSSASPAWSAGSLKTVRRPSLSRGAVEPRVGRGDPLQLHPLPFGEGLRVLPQRIPCASRCRAGPVATTARRRGPTRDCGYDRRGGRCSTHRDDGIQCLNGPADDVKRVSVSDGVGHRFGDHVSDPSGPVSGDVTMIGRHRLAPEASSASKKVPTVACSRPGMATPTGRCRGLPRRSGTCGGAYRRSHRSRSGAAQRTDQSTFRYRPTPE